MTINNILEYIDMVFVGAVLTFLTILFTFYNQVGVPLYNSSIAPIANFFSAVAASPKKMNQLEAKLDVIISELRPNGGASIKDQINRLEGAISMGEAQRLLILDNTGQGIWTSDKQGACTWVNNTLKAKVGGDTNSFLKENWVNAVHPGDRRIVEEEWNTAIKNQRDFNLFYRVVNMKTQEVINVHGIATPANAFDGSLVGYNGVIYFL